MAKISARGRWELLRLVKGDSVIVFCSDGTALWRRTSYSGYLVLQRTTRVLKDGWKQLDRDMQLERVHNTANRYLPCGWKETPCHVTYGSHEQRNGAYWYTFHRRFETK